MVTTKIKNHFVISIKKVVSLQQLLTINPTKITDCLQQKVHHLTYVFCSETIVGPKKPLSRRGSEAGRRDRSPDPKRFPNI
jgi:hypothetical protein